MLALVLLTHALAVTDDRFGVTVDLSAGLGRELNKWTGVGRVDSVFWWGPYDPDYILGRYNGLGIDVVSTFGPSTGGRALLEYRRGVDLIVVGWHVAMSAGPALAPTGEIGASGRLAVGARLRRSATVALSLRLEGGVDSFASVIDPAGGLTLGVSFGGPVDGGTE